MSASIKQMEENISSSTIEFKKLISRNSSAHVSFIKRMVITCPMSDLATRELKRSANIKITTASDLWQVWPKKVKDYAQECPVLWIKP